MSDVDDFLEHHGIKGMHWGVRKNKPPLTKRQQRAKDVRKEAAKEGAKAGAVTLAVTGAWSLHMIAKHDPESVLRGAAFVGKKMRVPMKIAAKAVKGARLVFGKDGKATYFPPGSFTPGMFTNAGPRALGSGLKVLGA